MSKPVVAYVLPEQLDDYWGAAGPLIDKAVQRFSGVMALDDVYSDLKEGKSLLWMIVIEGDLVAAMTTKMVNYPLKRSIVIDFIGGSRFGEWMETALDELKRIGLQTGVSMIEANGRKAFEKIAPSAGFKPSYTHYEMEI
jgi:hypothetical protein